MEALRRGVTKFKTKIFPARRHFFERLGKGQNPETLFITCADSRVVPNLITQTGPGELFVERNPGGIVPKYSEYTGGVSASIEYAVAVLNVRHVIVCAHQDCGAIKGILKPEQVENLPAVRRWLSYAEHARDRLPEGEESIDRLTEEVVRVQLENLRTHPSVAARLASGDLDIHGWIYDIDDGEIFALDPESGQFTPWPQAR